MADDQDGFTIRLDYAIDPRPRYGHGKPPHSRLAEILGRSAPAYEATLRQFLAFAGPIGRIPLEADPDDDSRPHWNNVWFSGIDPLSLYAFLAIHDPARYFEVGSGFSTRFARQAIRDHGLRTKITSIDPWPRANIDRLCDQVIRQPLEDVDPALFDQLTGGDVLLVDNSHRVFTNSDATVVFLDVMPRLSAGVLLGIHDIMLPNDYPAEWTDRFYSEQYVLAAYILAEGTRFDVVLPSTFVSMHAGLRDILAPIWRRLEGANPSGSSFWLRMR